MRTFIVLYMPPQLQADGDTYRKVGKLTGSFYGTGWHDSLYHAAKEAGYHEIYPEDTLFYVEDTAIFQVKGVSITSFNIEISKPYRQKKNDPKN